MNTVRPLLLNFSKRYLVPRKAYSSEPLQPVKYHGFEYYPRTKDFKDPPFDPPKVWLVKRIKGMKGRTKEEKKYLEKLNVDGSEKFDNHRSVVKNIPEVNEMLWKVKHLVEIRPIRWQGELPKDFCGTYLKESGELIISPKLKLDDKTLEVTMKNINQNKLNRPYWKSYLLKQWQNGYSGTI